jgi:hypothetical protein
MAWKDHLTRSLDEVNSSITGYPAAGDTASDSADIGAFFDDRQRAWHHLLQLRGKLSTALASTRLGGELVAGCADPPTN